MNRFKSNKIIEEGEAIAELLKKTRLNKNLSLKEVAKEVNIRQDYLIALEKGEYNKLPKGVYGLNFIKEYASFLRLDPAKISEIYKRETSQSQKINNKEYFSKQVIKKSRFLVLPKILRSLLILLVVLSGFVYLGVSLQKVVAPPILEIVSPQDNVVTKIFLVEIRGKTEPEAQLTINDELVSIDNDGNFREEANLKSGVNIIKISAKKRYSRENVVTRQILVKNE